jgi:hypothetical protein
MTLLGPLEKSGLGGEAGEVLAKDLLCGEALSPHTHCPARAAGSIHNDFIYVPARWFGASRLSAYKTTRGSSFPSKFGEEYSPRSGYQHKLPFYADDVAMAVSHTARRDPPQRREEVANLISIPRPTFVELGDAMRLLQEREAQIAYRLTDRYVDALMESRIAKSSSFEVYTLRRNGVFHIFKVPYNVLPKTSPNPRT